VELTCEIYYITFLILISDLPLIVTRAHIRKWIHERDVGKLEKLLWAGHGDRLLMETSASPRIRSFLESVPYIMVKQNEVFYLFNINKNLFTDGD
jgi:hypothetical protein